MGNLLKNQMKTTFAVAALTTTLASGQA